MEPKAILKQLGIADVQTIAPIAGGADTALWRVEHGGVVSALRVFRPGTHQGYEREVAAMEIASAANLPIPSIRAAGNWHDRPILLLSWCDGMPLTTMLQKAPWRGWSLGNAFGAMLARIHRVNAAALRQFPGHDWLAWSGPQAEHIQALLHERTRKAEVLLHLDYHPLNVMTDGTTITAVLDWANARPGDPRADVARTVSILTIMPSGPKPDSLLFGALRRILARAFVQGYCKAAGPLHDMNLFYAWAGMVMAEDQQRRAADPTTWLEQRHLDQFRQWAQQQLARNDI